MMGVSAGEEFGHPSELARRHGYALQRQTPFSLPLMCSPMPEVQGDRVAQKGVTGNTLNQDSASNTGRVRATLTAASHVEEENK